MTLSLLYSGEVEFVWNSPCPPAPIEERERDRESVQGRTSPRKTEKSYLGRGSGFPQGCGISVGPSLTSSPRDRRSLELASWSPFRDA